MTTQQFYKQGLELYDSLPEPLQKAVDLVGKTTNNGNDFETYKQSEVKNRVIDLAVDKFMQWKNTQPEKINETRKGYHNLEPQFNTGDKVILKNNIDEIFTIKNLIRNTRNVINPITFQKETSWNYSYSFEGRKGYHEEYLLKRYDETTRSAEAEKTSTKKTTIKKEKPAKQVAENQVELLPEEIKIIKRFLLFDGKIKTAKQISALLDYVQKAIIEKRIRKTSEFAKEVEDIQRMLIKAYKVASEMDGLKTELDATKKQHFTQIVNSYEPLTSVRLIKRYIALDSKPTKEKIQKLYNDFERFSKSNNRMDMKYNGLLQQMSTHLIRYNRNEIAHLPVVEQGLNGFAFLPFVAKTAAKVVAKKQAQKLIVNNNHSLSGVNDTGVMSVSDAKAMSFNKIGFTGKLKELIGDACEPTSIFIYGSGGSGKSGLSLQIADFLSSKNRNILYVAGEQFNTPTFTELLKKTGVTGGNNFKIVKDLNTLPLSNFDVIVIDSKDSVGLLQSYQFKELRDMHPNKIYIITSQGTKAGNFTGDEKWRNEVDTLIYCESGTASTLEDKNRWGAKASIKIY